MQKRASVAHNKWSVFLDERQRMAPFALRGKVENLKVETN